MINQLLDEDTWPELEEVLRSFAKRQGIASDKEFLFHNHKLAGVNLRMISRLARRLQNDRLEFFDTPASGYKNSVSLKEVLDFIHSNPKAFTELRILFNKRLWLKVSNNQTIEEFSETTKLIRLNDLYLRLSPYMKKKRQ